jgi:hypothetical protein
METLFALLRPNIAKLKIQNQEIPEETINSKHRDPYEKLISNNATKTYLHVY